MTLEKYILVLTCMCLCAGGCSPRPASSPARPTAAASARPSDLPAASPSAYPNDPPPPSQVLGSYEATVPQRLNLEQFRLLLGLQEGGSSSKSDPPDQWIPIVPLGDDEPGYKKFDPPNKWTTVAHTGNDDPGDRKSDPPDQWTIVAHTGNDKPEYNKAAILQTLIYHEISVTCWVVEANGNLTVLASQWAGKGKRIIVQQDYVSYSLLEKNGVQVRLGILLRVEADLVTLKQEVKLNGLFAAAVAAQTGSASGKLKVLVYGLSGEPINALLPMPSNLSEESFMGALTAIGGIKAKIYDEKVFVEPCLLPEYETNRSRPVSE